MSFIRVNGIAYNTDGVYSIEFVGCKAEVVLKERHMFLDTIQPRMFKTTVNPVEIYDLQAFVGRETSHSEVEDQS